MSPSPGSPEHPYLVQKTAKTVHRPPGAFLCLEAMWASAKIMHNLLTVYQTRSSLNICWQMAHLEMVHTLILRFANMEKWINSLNLSTPIFRTLQLAIRGAVTQKETQISHRRRKLSVKAVFNGNDYIKVGYLGKEVYDTPSCSLI